MRRRAGVSGRRIVVAEVSGVVFFATFQGNVASHAVCGAVLVKGWIDQSAGQGGGIHAHFMALTGLGGREVAQQVKTIAVGDCAWLVSVAHLVFVQIQEHGNARNPGFASILLAVAVFIQPHAVANHARQFKAEVIAVVAFALFHAGEFARWVIGLVTEFSCIGSSGMSRSQRTAVHGEGEFRLAAGGWGFHASGAGDVVFIQQQIAEIVFAGGIGLGNGLHHFAVGVSDGERDQFVGNAQFTGLADAVAGSVSPHLIPDAGGLFEITKIGGGVGAARCGIHRHGIAIGLAVVVLPVIFAIAQPVAV